MSAASRPGRGTETTSANVIRNLSASASGNFIRSSGARVGRRITTEFSDKNLPSAFTSLCRECDSDGFVQGRQQDFCGKRDGRGSVLSPQRPRKGEAGARGCDCPVAPFTTTTDARVIGKQMVHGSGPMTSMSMAGMINVRQRMGSSTADATLAGS
jgi:hypothetical protein